MSDIQQTAINALRFLAVDAVEKAKSGHPGAPLGDAPIAYLLFHKYMRHNPKNSKWANRDRFVLSNGHASALLYGVLHLTGYDVTIDDLKQLPAVGLEDAGTSGVRRYGRRGSDDGSAGPGLCDGRRDGDGGKTSGGGLQQAGLRRRGSLHVRPLRRWRLDGRHFARGGFAGRHAALGKMICLYDDNLISLDGPTELSFTENVTGAIRGLPLAYADGGGRQRPGGDQRGDRSGEGGQGQAFVHRVRTIIGYGSPQGGHQQGARRGDGRRRTEEDQENLNWPADKSFYVPEDAAKHWLEAVEKGKK